MYPCELALSKPRTLKKEMVYRKYNCINHTDFKADVGDAMLDILKYTDLDCAVRNYNRVLRELLDKHAPEHRRVITLRHRPCGFSDDHF